MSLKTFIAWGLLAASVGTLRAADSPPLEKSSSLKPKLETVFSRFFQRPLTIETVRWIFFPFKLAGTNLRLWESPGVMMADVPKATMTISLKTLTSGRLRISQMRFNDAKIYLRFTHDGKTNLTSMIADLAAFARKNHKPGQKQKVAYNVFRIENARLEVIDAETGNRPFGNPFVLNAGGDIDGLGPQTEFPFELKAVLTSTTSAINTAITGTLSNRPRVHVAARQVPLGVLTAYLPVVRWFDGDSAVDFDFSKAGAYTFWKLRFTNDGIKTMAALPFPLIKVDGLFHPYAPSHLNLTLQGDPTRVDVVVHVGDLIAKKVWFSVQSRDADIAECIQWCHTGYLMSQGLMSEQGLKEEMKKPLVWQVTGKADIDGTLSSVLGPELLRAADGHLTLNVREGTLTEMPGFVKALALLNLSALVQPGENSSGLKFETAEGAIDIKDGVARTRKLIMLKSPTLKVGLVGMVNFPKQVINARILIGVVNLPEEMIRRIPLVRRFNDGKEQGTVIPIWFTVKGPLDNPIVQRE